MNGDIPAIAENPGHVARNRLAGRRFGRSRVHARRDKVKVSLVYRGAEAEDDRSSGMSPAPGAGNAATRRHDTPSTIAVRTMVVDFSANYQANFSLWRAQPAKRQLYATGRRLRGATAIDAKISLYNNRLRYSTTEAIDATRQAARRSSAAKFRPGLFQALGRHRIRRLQLLRKQRNGKLLQRPAKMLERPARSSLAHWPPAVRDSAPRTTRRRPSAARRASGFCGYLPGDDRAPSGTAAGARAGSRASPGKIPGTREHPAAAALRRRPADSARRRRAQLLPERMMRGGDVGEQPERAFGHGRQPGPSAPGLLGKRLFGSRQRIFAEEGAIADRRQHIGQQLVRRDRRLQLQRRLRESAPPFSYPARFDLSAIRNRRTTPARVAASAASRVSSSASETLSASSTSAG